MDGVERERGKDGKPWEILKERRSKAERPIIKDVEIR